MQHKRIRVLFAISDLGGGGAERAVSIYLAHLDRLKFEPGLVLWRDVRCYDIPKDVPVWVLNKTRPWHVLRAIRGTKGILKTWRPHVVFSHLKYVNLVCGLAFRLASCKGQWIPCFQNNPEVATPAWARRLYGGVLASAYKVIAISEGVRKACVRTFCITPDKTMVLHDPVDLDAIDRSLANSPKGERAHPTIVTMGRLTEQKDQHTLLRAFAKVREQLDARLVILGEGPLRESLEQQAVDLGIREQVEFKGFVENPFSVLAQSDVFVLSSRWEGLCLALIEAIAAGLACISTRCPYGPEEVIQDEESGLLVNVGDAEGIAGAALKLLQDTALRRRLAQAGKRSITGRFSPEAQTRALEQLLKQALEMSR